MTDPDVCRRCADTNPTCCRHAAGEERFCFPLPEAEYTALRQAGVPEDAFVLEPTTTQFRVVLGRLFPGAPVAAAFPDGGQHRRLATVDGACALLTPTGCRLPRALRPLFCRTYPLWSVRGRITAFLHPNCLATRQTQGFRDLCRILGTHPVEIHDQVARLRTLLFPEE